MGPAGIQHTDALSARAPSFSLWGAGEGVCATTNTFVKQGESEQLSDRVPG